MDALYEGEHRTEDLAQLLETYLQRRFGPVHGHVLVPEVANQAVVIDRLLKSDPPAEVSTFAKLIRDMGTNWREFSQGNLAARALRQNGHFLGAVLVDSAILRDADPTHLFEFFCENTSLYFLRMAERELAPVEPADSRKQTLNMPAIAYDGSGLSQQSANLFGKYEIIDELAVGGMAEILLAKASFLSGITQQCVIKRILPEYSEHRKFVSMFIDEARITIGLRHPNIVQLFDFGQVDGSYYMAMEYVQGGDLATILNLCRDKGTGVEPRAAAFIARETCLGLQHAHEKKDHTGMHLHIVHRDISPHNVLIGLEGSAKLTDFGIAAAKNKLTLTEPGTVMGKFSYMSPEQALGRPVDNRTDVWATGVVLHEMLTCRRLFVGEGPVETVAQVCDGPIPRVSAFVADVPSVLDDVVSQALRRKEEERFASSADMAKVLSDYLHGERYDQKSFCDWLEEIGWQDSVSVSGEGGMRRPKTRSSISQKPTRSIQDLELSRLFDDLRARPDVWTLVDIGNRYLELGETDNGLGALRTAAAHFVNRGLWIQAICAFDGARRVLQSEELLEDFRRLGELRTLPPEGFQALIEEWDTEGFSADLGRAGPSDKNGPTFVRQRSPLFDQLIPEDFAELALGAKVNKVPIKTTIVREGEPGDSLYGVGRGRMVVYCKRDDVPPGGPDTQSTTDKDTDEGVFRSIDDNRIYLSALADGDFFGEFSFLTNKPRAATVETITESVVLEVSRETSNAIIERQPGFRKALLAFYKNRVGELMMAKNPVFASLAPEDRRGLLAESVPVVARDQDLIVQEGEEGDALFLVRYGEVEVFRDVEGIDVFINKLREGQFFGEMATLKGTSRTASVRAMGDVELLRIARGDLLQLLEQEPKLKDAFESAMAKRHSQTLALVAESKRIFEGV
jgi:serine/threonine protein kinase/CRP-like cAMP-binding protein